MIRLFTILNSLPLSPSQNSLISPCNGPCFSPGHCHFYQAYQKSNSTPFYIRRHSSARPMSRVRLLSTPQHPGHSHDNQAHLECVSRSSSLSSLLNVLPLLINDGCYYEFNSVLNEYSIKKQQLKSHRSIRQLA
jgi:hypothetical protein